MTDPKNCEKWTRITILERRLRYGQYRSFKEYDEIVKEITNERLDWKNKLIKKVQKELNDFLNKNENRRG